MDELQNSFEFPSPHLQEAVNGLWDKLKEVNGTLNFLTERNRELKDKLNSTGLVSKDDISKMKDMERSIENLVNENEEYLSKIKANEGTTAMLQDMLSSSEIFKDLYFTLLNGYEKLKIDNKRTAASFVEIEMLNTSLETVSMLEEQISQLKSDLDKKNLQISISSEEIISLKNIINDTEKQSESLSDLKSENEKFLDIIDTISFSRDSLKEESDKLKIELERFDSRDNHELLSLKEDNARLSLDNESLNERLKVLANDLEAALSQNKDMEKILEKLKIDNSDLYRQLDLINEQLALTESLKKLVENRDLEIKELNLEIDSLNDDILVLDDKFNKEKIEHENLFIDYQEAVKTIEDLKEDIEQRMDKDIGIAPAEFEQIKTDLEVKAKMIADFAQGEKDLLNRVKYLEMELEAKTNSFMELMNSQRNDSSKLDSLEKLLFNKDEKIDELIRTNKNLADRLVIAENSESAYQEIESLLAGLKTDYNEQLNSLINEGNRLQKELKTKTDSIKILETQIGNMQDKIRNYELSQIKSDENISLDELIKEQLINNLEKQLSKLEELSKK